MTITDLWDKAVQLFNVRELAAASAACDEILRIDADNGLAHWLLANVAIESGSPRAASAHALLAAGVADRLHVQDKLRISWSLIVTGELEAAHALLTDIDPDDELLRPWFFEAAHQLSMIEFPVQAKRLLDKISRGQVFVPPEICMLKGHLLSTLGNKDEAEELLEDAIAFGAASPRPHLLLSRLNLDRGRASRIDRLRKLAATQRSSPEWVAMIHYSLFNELDGDGNFNEAWGALTYGARALRASLNYDPALEAEIFENLARSADGMSARSFSSDEKSVEATPTPIFIVGLPRTGTTLVEQIIGNHPDVYSGGELLVLAQQIQWVSDRIWEGAYDLQASLDAGSLDMGLLGDRYIRGSAWRAHGARFYTDKNPRNFTSIGHIVNALPNSRIVHIRRNPVDACFSNFKMLFGPNIYPYSYDLGELVSHHRNYTKLMDSWGRIYADKIFTLDYEELVRNGADVVERLLEFCGLSPNAQVLDITSNRRAIMTESRSQLRAGIQDKYIGEWRNYERQLAPLVEMLNAAV